jgi:hypothetical protein
MGQNRRRSDDRFWSDRFRFLKKIRRWCCAISHAASRETFAMVDGLIVRVVIGGRTDARRGWVSVLEARVKPTGECLSIHVCRHPVSRSIDRINYEPGHSEQMLNRRKVVSSQIPIYGSCHKVHKFFWYKILKGSIAISLRRSQ